MLAAPLLSAPEKEEEVEASAEFGLTVTWAGQEALP